MQDMALSFKKYFRKTVGFGKYNKKEREWEDEVYVRELSCLEAGLGCALWDGSIIFARWLYENKDVYKDQICLELGAGIGLPSLVVGRYAKKVYITDYMTTIIDNLEYNVKISKFWDDNIDSNLDLNEEDMKSQQEKKNLQKAAECVLFNWDSLLALEQKEISESFKKQLEQSIKDNKNEKTEIFLKETKGKIDRLLACEVIYTNQKHHIEGFARAIKYFLAPTGEMHMIQSENRDGVNYLKELLKGFGMKIEVAPVDQKYVGNYPKGRNNFKQRAEGYLQYKITYIQKN